MHIMAVIVTRVRGAPTCAALQPVVRHAEDVWVRAARVLQTRAASSAGCGAGSRTVACTGSSMALAAIGMLGS